MVSRFPFRPTSPIEGGPKQKASSALSNLTYPTPYLSTPKEEHMQDTCVLWNAWINAKKRSLSSSVLLPESLVACLAPSELPRSQSSVHLQSWKANLSPLLLNFIRCWYLFLLFYKKSWPLLNIFYENFWLFIFFSEKSEDLSFSLSFKGHNGSALPPAGHSQETLDMLVSL